MPELTILHGCRTLQLTRGMNTLIDEADFERVGRFRWYAHQTRYCFYAARRNMAAGGRGIFEYLHRVLANAERGTDVDHWKGDSLDNTGENLRVSTHSENLGNSRRAKGKSRFKGVTWGDGPNPWCARVVVRKQKINLGRFRTQEEAARAYDAAAIEHFGEFACTNVEIHGPY